MTICAACRNARGFAWTGWWAALAVLSTSEAAAQTPEPQAVALLPTTVQELVVTGTRFPETELTSDRPIAVVGAETIERSGSLTLETVLNQMPQVVPSFSSAANNPSANGASFVDLRGFGPARNLVLLSGRRVVGANASNSVDLNTIPEALIDRVEVITGGASAVYGPDAVSGVVNIILKDSFEGFEARARTLVSQQGDGQEHEASITAGHSFSRSSLMASVGWAQREEIGKGARPFSAQPASGSSFYPGGAYVASGPNGPSQAAVNAVFASYGVAPGAVSRTGGFGGFAFNTDGTLIATGQPNDPTLNAQNYRGSLSEVASLIYPDIYSYNFQPANKLILPLDRWSGALFANAELTARTTVFAQATFTHYTVSTALAASPAPGVPNPLYPGLSVNGFTIPVTNPFIPPDLAILLASRRGDSPALAGSGPNEEFLYRFRTVALGPRQSDNESDVVNLLAGTKVDLGGGWRGDAFASFGRYDRTETQHGLLSIRRFEQVLDSPTGGTELCAGGVNPFSGTINAACRTFLGVSASFDTRVEQQNAVASASGPLFQLPAGPVLAVFGAEYRSVSYGLAPQAGVDPGDVAGFLPQTPVHGSVRFGDLFAEVTAPLLADRPFAHALEVTAGYRRSTERTTGGADSYKAELGWSPVADLRFRAAAQRAVRAPNVFERYEPAHTGSGLASDPCSVNNPARTPQVLDLCRRQALALGFQTAFSDTLSQAGNDVGVVNGGNPNVRPEQATTFTLGAVWAPSWSSPGLYAVHASVDGYEIKIHDAIAYQDPQLTLDGCYNIGGQTNPTYDPANPFCQRFTRSAVDFSLTNVQAFKANQATLDAAGVDFALGFRTDLAELSGRSWLGRLETSATASWLARFRQQASALQPDFDFAGTIGDANAGYTTLPRWKAQGGLVWSSGPVELGLAGRFIGAMANRELLLSPGTIATGVGQAWYWDLSGRWSFAKGAELRAGVLNLFDRAPELFNPSVDAGTEPSTYDVIGRRFWVGLTLRR